ncbi:MAG: hypothetical protein UY12_C0043G0007 [Parcubacteria group bacterium GW2011_GWA2_47_8b]|uniref:Uncharacterized protein n=1 Tax=Candidatus Harrisonbacteria bacterium RIFOXYA1_FULL_48_8 TaxID=1798411 RepID=A0A1G1ZU05_9BACT|nr:MAG: hypothetical protein UY12_C0043G0007 [Parcubacteria group bacterium GW2011_GWA2_47_8b]KKU93236.1 MAG: hypothetical protein UY24_C0024G0004 [Parcubacteria group bacterium GW2011_GWA1_48_11b]OGY68213.1 MAG: hypothetical protein A2214_01340 [Candidatus Harrisonbacteria bacterium RIFOXYA1_FULL_48_8]
MSFILSRGKQIATVILAVLVSTFVVALIAQGTTYIDTDSVGVATATPGAYLAAKGDILGEVLRAEDHIKTSFFLATSTTATSTLSRFGAELASTTIIIDGNNGSMAIGTTTIPDADVVAGTMAVDPALTISGTGGAANATGTLFVTGEGATGGQIILKSSDGQGSRCVSLIVKAGTVAPGDSAAGVAELLVAKVVSCPK